MESKYQYDLYDDFVDPFAKRPWLLKVWIGSNLLISLASFWQYFTEDDPPSFVLVTGVAFLISTFLLVLGNKRGGRPFNLKKDKIYLKIEDGQLKEKLKRFSKERMLDLSKVQSAMIGQREIILKLEGGREFFISSQRIQNQAKKQELEDIIRANFPH